MSKIKIIYERYADLGEKIIFPAFNHNCLYSLDKKTKNVEFLGIIPELKLIQKRSFFSVAEYKGKVFLIPFNANSIVVYDIHTRDFALLELRKACSFKNVQKATEDGKFACCSQYKNQLFLFPHFYPALTILDMETFEIQYDMAFVSKIEQNKFNDEPYIGDIDVQGKLVYGSIGCSNSIVIYDMDAKKADFKDIQYSGEGFNGIKIDDKYLVLAPRKQGPIVLFNVENGDSEEYGDYPKGYNYTNVPFHGICKMRHGYFFIPALANEAVFFDLNSKKMLNVLKVSEVLAERIDEYFDCDRLLAYGVEKDVFWFVNAKDHMLYEYDFESKSITSVELNCSHCPIEYKQIIAEEIWSENMQFELDNFIDLICRERV